MGGDGLRVVYTAAGQAVDEWRARIDVARISTRLGPPLSRQDPEDVGGAGHRVTLKAACASDNSWLTASRFFAVLRRGQTLEHLCVGCGSENDVPDSGW